MKTQLTKDDITFNESDIEEQQTIEIEISGEEICINCDKPMDEQATAENFKSVLYGLLQKELPDAYINISITNDSYGSIKCYPSNDYTDAVIEDCMREAMETTEFVEEE